jgi:transcriptional repressor NrdR
MKCIRCQDDDTRVLESRDDGRLVRRRRECSKCKNRFTTYERVELPKIIVIKRDLTVESFSHEKLSKGIRLSLEKRPFTDYQIDNLIDDIEQELLFSGKKELKSSEIGDLVIKKLKILDEVAYLRFISVFKSFKNAKNFKKEVDRIINDRKK